MYWDNLPWSWMICCSWKLLMEPRTFIKSFTNDLSTFISVTNYALRLILKYLFKLRKGKQVAPFQWSFLILRWQSDTIHLFFISLNKKIHITASGTKENREELMVWVCSGEWIPCVCKMIWVEVQEISWAEPECVEAS